MLVVENVAINNKWLINELYQFTKLKMVNWLNGKKYFF